jgi:hypothetical protein
LQASSEAGKFGPRRANCKFFLATCKKTKYTGMMQKFTDIKLFNEVEHDMKNDQVRSIC